MFKNKKKAFENAQLKNNTCRAELIHSCTCILIDKCKRIVQKHMNMNMYYKTRKVYKWDRVGIYSLKQDSRRTKLTCFWNPLQNLYLHGLYGFPNWVDPARAVMYELPDQTPVYSVCFNTGKSIMLLFNTGIWLFAKYAY